MASAASASAADAPPVVSQDEITTGEMKREMPTAKFIDNVEQFVGERDVKDCVAALQDLHSRYKYLESGLLSTKQSLKQKIPDIESALEMVQYLQQKKREEAAPLEVKYNLSENVYVNADVPVDTGKILLWIGAMCLLEYTFDEAEELLTKNLKSARDQEATVKEDSLFIRDQIVTAEVNIARCHNYGVLKRQRERETEKEINAGA
ncbi:unnamed protein product [Amoebophrya sp. A25]|nr:unnamed protein product [Amoebophrya sp. A25]|eukprot:GSA25T00013743001.1